MPHKCEKANCVSDLFGAPSRNKGRRQGRGQVSSSSPLPSPPTPSLPSEDEASFDSSSAHFYPETQPEMTMSCGETSLTPTLIDWNNNQPFCAPQCQPRCQQNTFTETNFALNFGQSFPENFHVYLRNGVRMPAVGLGTSHSGGYSHSTVVFALKQAGYRLIDTAKRYGVEQSLKSAICESQVPREELFLATKLWPTDYGRDKTRAALKGSLERLGVDYADLFMIHWPEVRSDCGDKWETLSETWRAIEMMYDEGYCKALGVSNYSADDLETMFETCSIKPLVNQIEFHPYQNPTDLKHFCEDHKIQIQGYCPLGKGQILGDAPIVKIAEAHHKTPAQVLIRWALQNNVVTIPKSTKEHRVSENIGVFDFSLTDTDMDILNGLHDNRKYVDSAKIQDKINSHLPDGYKLCLFDPISKRRLS